MMYVVLIALLDGAMGSTHGEVPRTCCVFCYDLKVSPSLLCFQLLQVGPESFIFLGFISLKGWPRLEKEKISI